MVSLRLNDLSHLLQKSMAKWRCVYGRVNNSTDENFLLLASIYRLTKNERGRVETNENFRQNETTANLHNDMIETVLTNKSINSGETLVVSVSQDE